MMNAEMSASARVFRELEAAILSGTYQRGETISENKLAALYHVSRTPVREAVKRLEQEGLVEYTENKTARVVSVSEEDVADIYDLRLRIEPEAVIRAARRMTDADYAAMTRTLDLQAFYADREDAESMSGADTDFHTFIYRLSGSTVYESVLTDLHRRIRRYRQLSQARRTRGAETVREHRAILEAMREGDESAMRELTAAHLCNARDNITREGNSTWD